MNYDPAVDLTGEDRLNLVISGSQVELLLKEQFKQNRDEPYLMIEKNEETHGIF